MLLAAFELSQAFQKPRPNSRRDPGEVTDVCVTSPLPVGVWGVLGCGTHSASSGAVTHRPSDGEEPVTGAGAAEGSPVTPRGLDYPRKEDDEHGGQEQKRHVT